MKTKKKSVSHAFQVPASTMALGEFQPEEPVNALVSPGAVALVKGRMTALELIRTIAALNRITTDLMLHLSQVCGDCDRCGGEEDCPARADAYIELPEDIRREADIPEEARLCGTAIPEQGAVLVTQAGYDHDLRDVPPNLLEALREAGVCIGELEEHLMLGDVVYG